MKGFLLPGKIINKAWAAGAAACNLFFFVARITLLRHFIWRATAKLRHTTVLFGAQQPNYATQQFYMARCIKIAPYRHALSKV